MSIIKAMIVDETIEKKIEGLEGGGRKVVKKKRVGRGRGGGLDRGGHRGKRRGRHEQGGG